MHIVSQIWTHTGSNRHAFCWWLVQLQRSFLQVQYVMVTNYMVMCLQWGLSHSMNSLCMISSAMTWQTTTAETKNVAAAFKQRCGNGPSWWNRSEEKGGRNMCLWGCRLRCGAGTEYFSQAYPTKASVFFLSFYIYFSPRTFHRERLKKQDKV